jgi:hypothetical protein
MSRSASLFDKGDYLVVPEHEGVYEVARTAGGTLHLRNIATGHGLACPPGAQRPLRHATAEEIGTALRAAPQVDLELGTAVRYSNPKAAKGLYVVIKFHSGGPLFNLARLGGDGNRYFAKVHPGSVTVVPPAEIPQVLAGITQAAASEG